MRQNVVLILGLFFFLNSYAMVGGQPVLPSENLARSLVGILVEHAAVSQSSYCTGTLLSKKVIITAAHCIKSETGLTIHVGFSNEPMKAINDGNNILVRFSHRARIYPDYLNAKDKFERKLFDVALIYLDEEAPAWAVSLPLVTPDSLPIFTDKILAVASGSERDSDTTPAGSTSKTGSHNKDESESEPDTVLKKAFFYILKDVPTYLAAMHLITQPQDPVIISLQQSTNPNSSTFLTQLQDDQKMAPGDSGSPALVKFDGVDKLLGILSGPLQLNNQDFGMYYVNLHEPKMNHWIRAHY